MIRPKRVLQSLGEAQRFLRPARGLPELAELGERPRQVGRGRTISSGVTPTRDGGGPVGLEGAQDLAERGGGLPIVAPVVVEATQMASRLAPQQAVIGRLGDGEGAVDRFLRPVGVAHHPEAGADEEGDHPRPRFVAQPLGE